MKLKFIDREIECNKVVKDESKETITTYDENDTAIASFAGISDFSLFTVEDGDWSEPPTTTEDRVDEMESTMDYILTEVIPSLTE